MINNIETKLTICIPTLNRCEKLKETLGALLAYEGKGIEILVSDNGSTDETWSYLTSLDDNRLSVSRNNENIGFTGNILKLLELSKTDFILLMSDEDFVLVENIEALIEKGSFSDDVGVFYAGVLNEDGSSFYYKYKKKKWIGKSALNKAVLSHSYMSGIIFNKKFINIDKFTSSIVAERVVLYPHEIIAYMILCEGGGLVTEPIPIAKQGDEEESEAIVKYNYSEYKERLKLFKQYNKIVSDLNYGRVKSRVFYRKMAIIASCVFVDEVLVRKVKPYQYLSEVFSLNCGFLFKYKFIIYSIAVFIKRKIK